MPTGHTNEVFLMISDVDLKDVNPTDVENTSKRYMRWKF